MKRNIERFECAAGVEAGKISGAVVNFSNIVEKCVCDSLVSVLKEISTQHSWPSAGTLQFSLIPASIERIWQEIRGLQKSKKQREVESSLPKVKGLQQCLTNVTQSFWKHDRSSAVSVVHEQLMKT